MLVCGLVQHCSLLRRHQVGGASHKLAIALVLTCDRCAAACYIERTCTRQLQQVIVHVALANM